MESLDAAVADLRDRHPEVVALLRAAVTSAGGDIEAGVRLVVLRLEQARPEDAAAVEVLLRSVAQVSAGFGSGSGGSSSHPGDPRGRGSGRWRF